jgi:hypothetical protein
MFDIVRCELEHAPLTSFTSSTHTYIYVRGKAACEYQTVTPEASAVFSPESHIFEEPPPYPAQTRI